MHDTNKIAVLKISYGLNVEIQVVGFGRLPHVLHLNVLADPRGRVVYRINLGKHKILEEHERQNCRLLWNQILRAFSYTDRFSKVEITSLYHQFDSSQTMDLNPCALK